MATNEENAINKVKEKLYKKLSYTRQDYDGIVTDLIGLFKSGSSDNKLNTDWDNVSESDIMFIFMSLMAAHKDILNYMIDYRTLEGFMATAKEVKSITRIASSYGFSLPGPKAARAEFSITQGLQVGETVVVEPFTSFIDDNNVSWTYVGKESITLSSGDTIELFQGNPYTVNGVLAEFANRTKTRIITDRSVAIGNNYNAEGCSRLEIDGVVYDEVENLYSYNELSGENVYAIEVDVEGLNYVQLQRFVDINTIGEDAAYKLNYIVTSGAKTKGTSTVEKSLEVDGQPTDITFTPVSGSFYAGSNSLTKEKIKEAFKGYYASAQSLVTLADYKNYVLNIQKDVPEVTKCLVIDSQGDTVNNEFDGSAIAPLNVAVYALQKDNTELDSTAVTDLLDSLNTRNVSGVEARVNDIDGAGTNPLELLDMTVSLQTTVALSDDDISSIRDIVYNYIMGRGIGQRVQSSEINKELALYGYDYFYGSILLTQGTDTDVSVLSPDYYQCYNIADSQSDISITSP